MNPNNHPKLKNILLHHIDPSPYQKRKYFDEEKLRELAASIENDGLIEPIIARPKDDRYELIAGERRFRAVKQYTSFETIQAKIIHVDDLQARRISAAENIQREDFSAIERIEAIVEIIDAYLIEDIEYNEMGNTPVIRVHALLSKLHSVCVSQNRKSTISEKGLSLFNKFVKQVELIFKKLPKRLEWQSFYIHDLPLIIDICDDIRDISLKNQLNKSQIKSLVDVKKNTPDTYQHIVNSDDSENIKKNDARSGSPKLGRTVPLNELSAREIKQLAEKITKTKIKDIQAQQRDSLNLNVIAKKLMMKYLGIPVDRIASRLNVSRTIVEPADMIKSIQSDLEQGVSVAELANQYQFPEPLIWHIALKNISDQKRFKALNWGLLTWDYWYWNDLDYRFGDEWPGRIPAQLVAHTLFYFSRDHHLIVDPMAGGGVVPDVCLAFNRRCWSFDLVDRCDTRPEIECYHWEKKNLQWPYKSSEKPDLIFIDPPYFKKKADDYAKESISNLSKTDYLEFFKQFFQLAYENAKSTTRLAFLNADWRNFQGISALNEDERDSILMFDYSKIMSDAGWKITQYIDCPMSTQRFNAGIVSQMQKNRILGVVRRTLIIARKG
ncbi:MAG: ParB/RepB/Spo0J family partition protein [Candidatus Magnetomorum sp.]|nr:ParB/RepB/Spo0J family partition protein [Candidatus Magnetomorum sp.]